MLKQLFHRFLEAIMITLSIVIVLLIISIADSYGEEQLTHFEKVKMEIVEYCTDVVGNKDSYCIREQVTAMTYAIPIMEANFDGVIDTEREYLIGLCYSIADTGNGRNWLVVKKCLDSNI